MIRASWFHHGTYLREGQLEPLEEVCPLCLDNKSRRPVWRLQTSPDVDLLSCATCGGCSASRMPTSETLRDYYRNYYQDSEERVTFDLPQRLAAHVFRGAFSAVESKAFDILDFGGGDADVSRRIAALLLGKGAHRVQILLVDFNAEISPPDSSRVSLERAESLDGIEEGKFDLVLASAIVEHIPHPRESLTLLLNALRPGGVFYARTPSVLPLLRVLRCFGLRSDFTYPGHVHDLGQKFWETIPGRLPVKGSIAVERSQPAVVETTLRKHPLRTVAAYLLKAPWRVWGSSYGLVGGWEVFFRRWGAP